MRIPQRIIRRREPQTAMQLLGEHLNTRDEAAWYAERIERLGRAMFGDLWDSEKAKSANQTSEQRDCSGGLRPSPFVGTHRVPLQ